MRAHARSGAAAAPGADWDARRALSYLLRLLARRDYAQQELRQRLARKGVSDAVAEAALARLRELDLVDDLRTATQRVRSVRHRKGRIALARDLAQRGIGEEDREAALRPLTDEDQRATAASLLQANAWRFRGLPYRKALAKAAGLLARRGFPGDAAHEALLAHFGDPPDALKDQDEP